MKSTKFGCGVAVALALSSGAAHAKWVETVVYSFTGKADGGNPFSGLIVDKAGVFYGTTVEGGTAGLGTIFKLAPDGTETVLSSFTGADGSYPEAGVIMDKQGNFYGTASEGGAGGLGTVYKLAANGTKSVLHSFTGTPDGKGPGSSLIMDNKGALYGTAYAGGAHNQGVVFKVTSDGVLTVLHSFDGDDGAAPQGSLILDAAGTLYGTTSEGGSTDCGGGGCGTVFKLAPKGKSWTETVLHAFNEGDGVFPNDGLIMDKAGNLYGTTFAAGAGGNGSVFKIAPKGHETVLWSFNNTNGSQPYSGLVLDKHGNLYGTTLLGGAGGLGVAFEITASGAEKVLYPFNSDANGTDGFEPYAGLIEDKSGNLYGTTYGGGAESSGAVVKITRH